jgi:drug/metabolite transporter (DMT)-like permease
MAFGVQHIDAGLAAILTSVTPIASLVIGRAMGDSGSWHGPAGVALGVVGVAVVAAGAIGSNTNRPIGIGLIVVSSLCWALGMVGMRLSHGAMPLAVLVAWQLILGTPVLFATAWFATGLSARWSWDFVVALIYAGLLAKAISFLLQLWIVGKASMLAASSVAFLIPIFGTVAGLVFFHESIRLSMVVGSIVILAGVAFVAHDRGRMVGAAAPAG